MLDTSRSKIDCKYTTPSNMKEQEVNEGYTIGKQTQLLLVIHVLKLKAFS